MFHLFIQGLTLLRKLVYCWYLLHDTYGNVYRIVMPTRIVNCHPQQIFHRFNLIEIILVNLKVILVDKLQDCNRFLFLISSCSGLRLICKLLVCFRFVTKDGNYHATVDIFDIGGQIVDTGNETMQAGHLVCVNYLPRVESFASDTHRVRIDALTC